MNSKLSWLPALLLLAAGGASAQMDTLIETCNGCHGDNGVSQWNDVPTIAGIDAFVHSEALYIYADEARPCETVNFKQGDTSRSGNMCDLSKDLTDEQIEALAEHYAALPFVPAEQAFDAALASQGEAIHEAECSRCHSDGGSNPEDEASILAGQWMGYLERAFAEFKAGEREKPKQGQEKIEALSDDQVQALLHYYASQQ